MEMVAVLVPVEVPEAVEAPAPLPEETNNQPLGVELTVAVHAPTAAMVTVCGTSGVAEEPSLAKLSDVGNTGLDEPPVPPPLPEPTTQVAGTVTEPLEPLTEIV